MTRPTLATALALVLFPVSALGLQAQDEAADTITPRILVFTKTAAYRHDSIENGIEAIAALGKEHGFTVVETADAAQFAADTLALFDAVVFLSTTGDVLN